MSSAPVESPAAAVPIADSPGYAPSGGPEERAEEDLLTQPAGVVLPEASGKKLTLSELTTQLEALLSRDAILNHRDQFISNLIIYSASPDLTVPADGLVRHPLLAAATVEEILSAAEASDILSTDMDSRGVKPELRAKRSTLIIREAKSSVTPKDILQLLQNCPDVTVDPVALEEVPLDVPRCCTSLTSLMLRLTSWFLTFVDEDVTASVAWWLRTQSLLGEPVQVRIKTESALRLDLIPPVSSPPRLGGRQIRRWRGENCPSKPRGGRWAASAICKVCLPDTRCQCPQEPAAGPRRRSGRTRGGRYPGAAGGCPNATLNGSGPPRSSRHRSGCPSSAVPASSEKIVVVTPSEFPPLCEAVMVKPNCGYPGPDFQQHSMEAVREICEKLPAMSIPLAASAAAGASDVAAVFEEAGPRQHEWCFDAFSRQARPKPLRRGSKPRNGKPGNPEVVVLSESLMEAVEDGGSRAFWAKQTVSQQSKLTNEFREDVVLPTQQPPSKANFVKFGSVTGQ